MALYQDGILISGANQLPQMTMAEYLAIPVDERPTYWVCTDRDYDDLSAENVKMANGDSVEEQINNLQDEIDNKVDTSAIANNLTTSSAGYVLDARQGKALNDYINKHTFGSAINIKSYTSQSYTATSDGYLYLATVAGGLIEVLIGGLTVNVVAPSLGGAKNFIFIRKGMTIKYNRCYPTGSLGDMTANFYPLT